MKSSFLTLFGLIVLSSALVAQEKDKKALAGWLGVLPEIQGYQRTFDKPAIEKKTHSQTARYEWTGGRLETVHITLLRDAEKAKIYTPEGIRVFPEAPKVVSFEKRAGYLWIGTRLVIALGGDQLVMLEAPTAKAFQSDLVGFAKKLDLDACARALEQPPRTDGRTPERFRAMKKGMSLAEVSAWVGPAEKDIGSGIHIFTYALDDGSRVLIGFPDLKGLIYVKHEDKAGNVVDLVK